MNNEIDVMDIENRLRKVEKELESIGSSICSVNGGADSWSDINSALKKVQSAIRNTYQIC